MDIEGEMGGVYVAGRGLVEWDFNKVKARNQKKMGRAVGETN